MPVIQPPIMRALTNKKERGIKMRTLRPVSKLERILFPLIIAVIISLLLPSAAPLIGCLMLGNLMQECGVVDRLAFVCRPKRCRLHAALNRENREIHEKKGAAF